MSGENSLRRFAEEKNAGVSSLDCARDFGARLSSQPALSNGAELSNGPRHRLNFDSA
jgi:hypothetical protein